MRYQIARILQRFRTRALMFATVFCELNFLGELMPRLYQLFFLCQILTVQVFFNTSTLAQDPAVSHTEYNSAAIFVPAAAIRSVSSDDSGDSDSYKLRRRAREYNFEIGYSPFEPTNFNGKKEFNTAGRKLGSINVKLGRVIGTKKSVTYTYLFGFTPLVVLLKNEVRNNAYLSPQATPGIARTKHETSYGAGFTPANFRFAFFPHGRIKPYLQAGAGFLILNKPIPIPESKRLQFTGDMGGGLMIHRTPDRAWFLGYKYYHISNGNRTKKIYNPGFNANVFYVGYSFF